MTRETTQMLLGEVARLTKLVSILTARVFLLRRELAAHIRPSGAGRMTNLPDVAVDLMAEGIPFDRWTPGGARYAHSEEPQSGTRQTWYSDVEICERPAPTFLIDGLLPDKSLGVLWGASEVGKTFLALAWALSVATGRTCLGRGVVTQGCAVHVVGEGAAHFGRRIIAWKLANRWTVDEPAGLMIHDGVLDLGDEAAVSAALSAMHERRS